MRVTLFLLLLLPFSSLGAPVHKASALRRHAARRSVQQPARGDVDALRPRGPGANFMDIGAGIVGGFTLPLVGLGIVVSVAYGLLNGRSYMEGQIHKSTYRINHENKRRKEQEEAEAKLAKLPKSQGGNGPEPSAVY